MSAVFDTFFSLILNALAKILEATVEHGPTIMKFVTFAVLGVVMFPAWILVITLHDWWIGLID